MRKKTKRKPNILIKLLASLIVLCLLWYINNLTLKTTNVIIYSSKIHSEVKIAAISDLHYDRLSVSGSSVKKRIEKQNPDLVFVLGDMYSTGSSSEDIDKTADFIISLSDICPVYFVPGEHDDDIEYLVKLKNNDINVMDYKCQKIWVDGNQLEIYGIDNVYFSDTFNLENEFPSPDSSIFSILLAHIPMYRYYQNFGTDLTVCGDTHGEIVQLPFLGCVRYNGEWFPELHGSSDDVYDKGLFKYIGGYMFITSGLGNYPLPLRFYNRPEVAVITLAPSE